MTLSPLVLHWMVHCNWFVNYCKKMVAQEALLENGCNELGNMFYEYLVDLG